MYRLGQCSLVYIHQGQDENYNPVIEAESRLVKCQLMESFSVNYYQGQTRDMRRSKNIIVDKTRTFDLIQDSTRYKLEYVDFGTIRYKVINILKNRDSDLTMILDCEEVINE